MSKFEHLQSQLELLPTQPGVYQFFDKESTLIYVGKAKSLKNRVRSYFTQSNDLSVKTRRLASQVKQIKYTLVNTEFDSFLLENSLIKENKPRYNIQLKDDKSFPYIVILNERFPRIISSRRYDPKVGAYFGPYSNVKAMNTILDLIRKLFLIRTCSFNLSEQNINNNKYKECLEYHIGNCLAPCVKKQDEDDYNNQISQATQLLKGNINFAKNYFIEQMKSHAENLDFEKAEAVKLKLERIEKFQSRTQIVNPQLGDLEVYTIIESEQLFFLNYMSVNNGSIRSSQNFEIKKKLDETTFDILIYSILFKNEDVDIKKKHFITNVEFDLEELGENINLSTPKIGDKKKLITLSLKNANQYKFDKLAQVKPTNENRILLQLKEDLRLKDLPLHIECFDNSNIQGTNPVASMVCFKGGKPSKKDYRHYNIKTVIGPDDFSSMNEVVTRRYKRLLEENQPLPNLIVIDGGKGQLSSACDALRSLNIYGKIPIIGIAKRLEELFYPGDTHPLFLNKKSESLVLLQHIRNEAHRFAITFHRQKRSLNMIHSKLSKIKGIGPTTEKKLMSKFKSLKRLKEASESEITNLVGEKINTLIQEGIKKGIL